MTPAAWAAATARAIGAKRRATARSKEPGEASAGAVAPPSLRSAR